MAWNTARLSYEKIEKTEKFSMGNWKTHFILFASLRCFRKPECESALVLLIYRISAKLRLASLTMDYFDLSASPTNYAKVDEVEMESV